MQTDQRAFRKQVDARNLAVLLGSVFEMQSVILAGLYSGEHEPMFGLVRERPAKRIENIVHLVGKAAAPYGMLVFKIMNRLRTRWVPLR